MRRMKTGYVRPVRRKLLAAAVAYLAGIYLSAWILIPSTIVYVISVFFLGAGFVSLRRRKRTLFFWLVLLTLFGNWRAASELSIRDTATRPGVEITGRITRIVSDTRVYIDDVVIDGERWLNRPAVVTLMTEEDEPAGRVYVGQTVSGTGRLFEQDEARNPGETDRRIQALCDGYDLSGYILPGWNVEGKAVFSLRECFRLVKMACSKRIAQIMGNQSPLFQAVMIGDRTMIDDALMQSMRLTGIAHILSVSGMHLSMIASALHKICDLLFMCTALRFGVMAILLGAYAGITGGAVGTIRAFVMAMIQLIARLTGKQYDSLTSLAIAALAITMIQPLWALSASFQFSFFVVMGILLLGVTSKRIEERTNRLWLQRGLRPVSLSAAAQFTAMPMQLSLYGYVPLLSLGMNVISGAMMPVLMYGGWAALMIGLLSDRAAAIAAYPVIFAAETLERLSFDTAAFAWGILRLPAPERWMLILFAALMFSMSGKIDIRRKRKALCLSLSAVMILLYIPRFGLQPAYVQLDVGQGDAGILRTGRHAALIDAGPENGYAALRYLRHEGLFPDIVILSHLDEDHAGGLGLLLDSEVEINRIAMPAGAEDTAESDVVIDALVKARERGILIETYQKGDVIRAGEFTLSVLSPDETLSGSNERSFALSTVIGGMMLLTLGDLPEECEMESVPRCDILKVSHHGSRYATSRRLIEQARPEMALISVGANSYGHPADRVLLDLESVGAAVYRTDQSGCLTVRRKGDNCFVKPFLGR